MTDNEITYEIRGAIYDVYKNLGPGLLESVYEEALVYELEKRGLKVGILVNFNTDNILEDSIHRVIN